MPPVSYAGQSVRGFWRPTARESAHPFCSGELWRRMRQRHAAPALILDDGPKRIGMVHIPFGVELPRGFAQNVTKDKQTAFKDLPCRWIASQLDGKSCATGTKATILRLIPVGASRKQRLVFCRGEVVGSLRQADLVLSLAACRRALREVGHGVVAQQHHGVLPNGWAPWRMAYRRR